MRPILKTLLAELHQDYFKPNGFKKDRHRFRRQIEHVIQEVEFQSSQWNSVGTATTFYVNLSIGFDDLPVPDGVPALPGSGRMEGFVPGAPPWFELREENYDETRELLNAFLPLALAELPKHYEDVRSRDGYYTPLPLPETWRV